MKNFDELLMEATQSVEGELKIEDKGWLTMGGGGKVVTDADRIANVKSSRLYYAKDPLGKQAIRLWTDYTFGGGMTWGTDEDATQKELEGFWNAKINQSVLSARGQRKASDKLLVDGEVFFAIFLGSETTIRLIDPLEITEIITDPDDKENVKFYRRDWTNAQGQSKAATYRSTMNPKGESTQDSSGATVSHSDEALVYHLAYNTIEQRGNPLLLPALDWIKQYRRFLASRVAVMLALARFAWLSKVKGGQSSVDAVKAATNDKTPNAGSTMIENMGVDTVPIKTESGASNAYQDGRMLKLQVCSAVGIPEQYFGDISIGNLATAKTVELPMMKMFQSYQATWRDVYTDINEIVLEHAGIAPDKWYVDMDFPAIAPEDVALAAAALSQILAVMPELGDSDDVKQMALMTLGVNDPKEVLDGLSEESITNARLVRGLIQFKETIKEGI